MKTTTAFVISHDPDASCTKRAQATDVCALTLTRAFGRKGIPVVRVHPNRFEDSLSSRFCRAVEICPDMYQSEGSLTQFLLDVASNYRGKKVLVPASDDCSLFIARNEVQLAAKYILLNPTAATMETVKDKRAQHALAKKAGVPTPQTFFPRSEAEVTEIAQQLDHFPYLIKPLEARKWRLQKHAEVARGQKAVTVNSRDELINEYRRISGVDKRLMIQEVIDGADEHLLTFLGYCSSTHKPLAHCVRSKLRQEPIDFGYCTATVSCHNNEVEGHAKRILNQSRYTGLVGIEFKYDQIANDFKLIEINTRPATTTGIAIGCGVNLPVIAFNDVLGNAQAPVTNWDDGVIWLHLSQDIAAALELRRRGRLRAAEWFRSIRGKRVHALFALDDLRPFCKFYFRLVRRHLANAKFGRMIPSLSRSTRRWFQRVGTRMF